jgi:3-hydroxyisobutyrate dehydrogenase
VEAMRPVLEIMGSNIYHTGELGSGNITKLVNNIIGITSFFVSTEALTIAQKLGMRPHTLASILENSTGRNFLTKDWESGRKIFASFSQTVDSCKTAVNLSRKDLDYARQLAAKLELPSTFLHSIIDGITRVSYEEIHEKWQSLTQWQSPADEQEG